MLARLVVKVHDLKLQYRYLKMTDQIAWRENGPSFSSHATWSFILGDVQNGHKPKRPRPPFCHVAVLWPFWM